MTARTLENEQNGCVSANWIRYPEYNEIPEDETEEDHYDSSLLEDPREEAKDSGAEEQQHRGASVPICEVLSATVMIGALWLGVYALTQTFGDATLPVHLDTHDEPLRRRAEDTRDGTPLVKTKHAPVAVWEMEERRKPQEVKVAAMVENCVVGYNEPDQGFGYGGAHMNCYWGNCYWAVKHWMKMVGAAKKKGYSLFVGPGMARRQLGTSWYEAFLNRCCAVEGCPETVNYINYHWYETHCYGPYSSPGNWKWAENRIRENFKRVMAIYMDPESPLFEQLPEEHKAAAKKARPACRKYKFQGLFITELAVREAWCGKEKQVEWAKTIIPELVKDPWVAALSWFAYDWK
eukprot:TRINITY_DN17191_c0_g1_i2.p1 TRINITY_DN17191_c0_g1~~TRINITY_DN17191_c0_g1_i2.p1  ORF type:complete len:349 (-),score=56.36 TRINITY_DN17191_c0_g1_i2:226-1272(-)